MYKVIGDCRTLREYRIKVYQCGYKSRERFSNMTEFLDFCHKKNLTSENSLTWWNEKKQQMHIAY